MCDRPPSLYKRWTHNSGVTAWAESAKGNWGISMEICKVVH
jgi:hypothetical protein